MYGIVTYITFGTKDLRQKQILQLCVSDCDGIAKALTLTDLPEAYKARE